MVVVVVVMVVKCEGGGDGGGGGGGGGGGDGGDGDGGDGCEKSRITAPATTAPPCPKNCASHEICTSTYSCSDLLRLS